MILAIESSCDETSCSIVKNGTDILSLVTVSQIKLHQKTKGVVPEVAARSHLKDIIPVIDQALAEAHLTLDQIDALAVTIEPGLKGSLLVGIQTARTLALITGKKLYEINHIDGHIYSTWLTLPPSDLPKFPILTLSVSGGHNSLYLIQDHSHKTLLGHTLDDAAGEAFDKVAKLLGLPYPGGPEIERLAKLGDPQSFHFPRPMINSESLNFSFSGLKTAVLYKLQKPLGTPTTLTKKLQQDISASFQEAVIDSLLAKLHLAEQTYHPQEIHITGGVSANTHLRTRLLASFPHITIRYPQSISYCTDNAAMIASAAYFQHQATNT